MKRSTLPIALALISAFSTGVLAQAESAWTVKSALKQIDKALAELRGLSGEVQWNEVLDGRTVQGSGAFHLSFAGKLRAELGGSNARTVLVTPLYLHVYKPAEELAQIYYLPSQPELLAQYVMIGFVPAGSFAVPRFL